MPRKARVESKTKIYHVMSRALNKQILFDDGKKRIASGMNEYPKNYDELTDYLNKIIGG